MNCMYPLSPHSISFLLVCMSFQTAHSFCRSIVLYIVRRTSRIHVRIWAISLLKLVSINCHLTWCLLWSHSFVMSLEPLVGFSLVSVEVNAQMVCQCHHWLGFAVATVFTYKCERNYAQERDNLMTKTQLQRQGDGKHPETNKTSTDPHQMQNKM